MKTLKLGGMVALLALGAMAGLQACSDDEDPAVEPKADSGIDGTVPDTGTPVTDGGTDSGSTTLTFAIPAAGGSVDFPSAAGKVTFKFPASAGGKTITIAATTATAIGWPADQFVDAIKLGPDGTRFTDPVDVTFEKNNLVGAALTFADAPSKGPASPLKWDATSKTFKLVHFTTLVIVPPGKICDSQGYQDNPNSLRCPDAGATTFRQITCKGYAFCTNINASCCVDPAVDSGTTCTVESQVYGVSYTPSGSNGGQYPYCDVDAGDWDGGADAGQGCDNIKPTYIFNTQNTGCAVVRDCGPIYRMDCNGTTCNCLTQQPQANLGSFPQGTACDTSTSMKTAYVQNCNFPPN